MDANISPNHAQDSISNAFPERIALEVGDYYLEGNEMVFTAAFLLKIGSCCGSNCRHCPYEPAEAAPAGLPD